MSRYAPGSIRGGSHDRPTRRLFTSRLRHCRRGDHGGRRAARQRRAGADAVEPALLNPPGMSKPPAYSHVVEVNGPHRTVYLAGQTGVDASGKVAEGFRAQAVQVMENIKTALASVGGGFEHVVKLTSYLTNLEADGAGVPRGARAPISRTMPRCPPRTSAAGPAPRQSGLSGRGRGDRGAAAEGLASSK